MGRRAAVTVKMFALTMGFVLVQSCGGGGGGGGDGGDGFTPIQLSEPGVVFVTSVAGNGNLGSWADAGGSTGLAAADAVCASRAAAAGLSGTFVAWMSDENDDAWCRVHGLTGKKADNCGKNALPAAAGPWVRTDGFPFSEGIDLLAAGTVYAPARFDEFGSQVPLGSYYFTATSPEGIREGSYSSCSAWSSSLATYVRTGSADATATAWSSSDGRWCDDEYRLLCMQVGQGPPHSAFASSGRKVFLAQGGSKWLAILWGASGASAGDTACRFYARGAGLENADNYRAWLSDSALDAAQRITGDGPWVRLDGVKVADSKADLVDGSLFAPINLYLDGTYSLGRGVWTGTLPSGQKSAYHCSDWTDGTVPGEYGSAVYSNGYWTKYPFSPATSIDAQMYCFEDDPWIMINEVDSDTPSTDTLEFVELYDGGVGNVSLSGYTLVFIDGSTDQVYYAADLDGLSTDGSGFFVAGNSSVPGVGLVFHSDTLQNGADAVLLALGDAGDFTVGTSVDGIHPTRFVDALVYDTDDPDDAGLLVLMSPGSPQVNENENSSSTTQSMQRSTDGSGGRRNGSAFTVGTPSPGAANNP